jgi:hypothetical protein
MLFDQKLKSKIYKNLSINLANQTDLINRYYKRKCYAFKYRSAETRNFKLMPHHNPIC